jgi:pimeloyl-ACP methyl ester carboxylesterase
VKGFLVTQLASFLEVDISLVDPKAGIEDLGLTSLASLRLSQQLRRFLGREFSAFALQNNPTIEELTENLIGGEDDKSRQPAKGRVLCLHGFRTSSVILQQQLLPLTSILHELDYELVVPNGPHAATGPAEGAEDLDDDDSYGWWLYDGDGHDSKPIGLEQSVKFLMELGPFDGIVGFSQGGAMAALMAGRLGAKWALLFSPVYVPGSAAQCKCPTLVAYDTQDQVFGATKKLLTQIPTTSTHLNHGHGHRLPPIAIDSTTTAWWGQIAGFLKLAHAPE